MKTLFAAGALALVLAAPQAAAQTGAPPLDPVLEGQLERAGASMLAGGLALLPLAALAARRGRRGVAGSPSHHAGFA